MFVAKGRVRETSTTTGTGDFTLAGNMPSFISFNTAGPVHSSDRFHYLIVHKATEWEYGRGYLSNSTTLVREQIIGSSNGGALVNFTSGTKDVGMIIAPELERNAILGMRGSISGLQIANSGGISSTLSIGHGCAAFNDTANSGYPVGILPSTITKTTGAWAAGSGVGCLDQGTIAPNTWYYFYIIGKNNFSSDDIVMSTVKDFPLFPSGYSRSRRFAAMKTNGSSQWPLFTQVGNEIWWGSTVTDLDTTTSGTTAADTVLSVPPIYGIKAIINAMALHASSNTFSRVSFKYFGATPGLSGAPIYSPSGLWGVSNLRLPVWTDGSVQYQSSNNSTTMKIFTLGWEDHREMDSI